MGRLRNGSTHRNVRSPLRSLRRGPLFAALSVVLLLVAAGYIAGAALRDRTTRGAPIAAPAETADAVAAGSAAASAALRGGRQILFRGEPFADVNGHLALAPLDAPEESRLITPLPCARVHFAAGWGLCLRSEDELAGGYSAYTFGPDLRPLRTFRLAGIPSRARVSPDGRYGAATVFVTGHSYSSSPGAFSTETTLIDMATGERLANLEEFEVTRDGKRVDSPDFNYWGVTFARRSDRFYATLATRGRRHLVEGSVSGRRMRILRENVECPSLSPDGERIAYKKALDGGKDDRWRLHVLDLATMADTPLAETRSVDDQVEWLDRGDILYSLGPDVYVLPADGGGRPRKLLAGAYSPAVVR